MFFTEILRYDLRFSLLPTTNRNQRCPWESFRLQRPICFRINEAIFIVKQKRRDIFSFQRTTVDGNRFSNFFSGRKKNFLKLRPAPKYVGSFFPLKRKTLASITRTRKTKILYWAKKVGIRNWWMNSRQFEKWKGTNFFNRRVLSLIK